MPVTVNQVQPVPVPGGSDGQDLVTTYVGIRQSPGNGVDIRPPQLIHVALGEPGCRHLHHGIHAARPDGPAIKSKDHRFSNRPSVVNA
jgi:hypothetical protein